MLHPFYAQKDSVKYRGDGTVPVLPKQPHSWGAVGGEGGNLHTIAHLIPTNLVKMSCSLSRCMESPQRTEIMFSFFLYPMLQKT